MFKRAIIVNGYPRSGKDTFIEYCIKHCFYYEATFGKIGTLSSIDPIKEIAYNIGWMGKKNKKSRKFLSDLKDLTTKFNHYSQAYILNQSKNYDTVFIQSREPEDIEYLKEKLSKVGYSVYTVLVDSVPKVKSFSNHADENVYDFNYDFYIDNNSTLDNLFDGAESFIDYIHWK